MSLGERPRGSARPTPNEHYNSLPRTSIEGALDKERAENVANSISNNGGTALSHVADVSNLDDVEAMVARAEEELGPPFSRKAARKIAAPLARKDGSHNAPSHQRV